MKSPREPGSAGARARFALVVVLGLGLLDGFDLLRVTGFQWQRQDTPDAARNAVLYVGTYLVCAAGLVGLLLHPWRWLRGLAWVLVSLLAAVQAGFASVNGTGFGHHEAALLWSEAQFARPVLSFFAPKFALPVAGVLLASLGLALWSRRLVFARGGVGLIVLALLGAGAGWSLLDRTFGKVMETPVPARIPLLATWVGLHRSPVYVPREAPDLLPARPPIADHIVFVMDESVSGHWLGLNGARPDTTPWLSSGPDHVFNFGIASSISNLSSSSNLLVQTGLTPERLPDVELRSLRGPNVFAYMALAGYTTALIDAQSYSRRPPNLMTRFDLEAIDRHVQIRAETPQLEEHAVDLATLPVLMEQVLGADRSFTYLVKNGAHIPYSDKFPPDRAVVDREAGIAGDYQRALEWSVDVYLRELSTALEASGRNALVVYTSDHGQILDGAGGRRVTPHATQEDPPSEQAAVPLILLAFGERTREAVSEAFDPAVRDRASGFEIFPTLLEVAGYARSDATRGRVPSLLDGSAPRPGRVFVSGNIFARDGGVYINNPGYGDAFYLNEFRPPKPHRARPSGGAGSAGTRGEQDRGAGISPTGSATSST